MKKMILLVSLMFLMAACASQAPVDEGPAAPERSMDAATEEVSEPAPAPVVDTAGTLPPEEAQPVATPNTILRPLVEEARQDLIKRLNVSEEDIVLAKTVAINWPDSSLGCPQPDMVYMQVITPGYKVTFTVDGQFYNYHSDESSTIIYCAAGDGYPTIPLNPDDITDGEPWVPVD